MAYDQKKAELYNQLITQGVPPVQAAQQAGIGYLQLVNAQRQEGDGRGPISESSAYRLGSNGQIGPRNPSPTPPAPAEITQNDPTTVTVTRETVIVPAEPDLPTPTVVDRLVASERNSAEADAFLRTAQPNYALPGATPVTPNNYTTTSTVNVSGGGVTTVVATPSTPTPASQRAQAEADATLREIEALQFENSGFGPQLTEAQMAANDARILQLTEKYDRERAAATSAGIPGVPSVTTQPNTTTTDSTIRYETAAANNPVPAADPLVPSSNFADTEITSEQATRPPLGIGGNYTTNFNPETGTYDVVNLDNGQVVESGLSELNAQVTASQFSQGDPQFETPEMPPELPDVTEPEPPGGNFGSVFDPETQSWAVVDNDTGQIVQTGLATEADAELQAQLDSQPDPYANQLTDDDINESFAQSDLIREPTEQDADEYLTEGFVQTEGGLYVSPEDVDPDADPQAAEADGGLVEFTAEGSVNRSAAEVQETASQQQAILANARAQAALREQRRQANEGDWRVKLRLAPGSTYLYRADDGSGRAAGILQPLAVTDGVIFPYTPQINSTYKANYNPYDLTHSNYRGYFYQNSAIEEISITATFTAQDTSEANYLLAVIHFFRSITKMFYGQDAQRGAPPPLVFLQGLGQYQFNLHPCVVSQFVYNLPNDVDYIRAGSPNQLNTNLLQRRDRQSQTVSFNPFQAIGKRLEAVKASRGGINTPPPPPTLGTNRPTYVPTKIDMTITLLPMQSREQVSKQFSLKQYANGDLLKGGFW